MLKTSGAIAAMVMVLSVGGNSAAADNPQAAPQAGARPSVAAAGAGGASLADAVRGGWVADIEGVRHIFVLKVLDGVVSGVYCDVDCGEPSHLSLLERGSLTAEGVRFQLHRLGGDGKTPERADVSGRIAGNQLVLTFGAGTRTSAGGRQWTLQRDPRKPKLETVEEMFARRGITSGPLLMSVSPNPYVPPGPNEMLTPAALEGLWLWGSGPGKQNFIFRRVGGQLLGVVCGPCDNPYSFGVIDNVTIHGETLTFDINHTDWGFGIELGPFANHASATVSKHEMHLHSVQHAGTRTIEGDMVLLGPITHTGARAPDSPEPASKREQER